MKSSIAKILDDALSRLPDLADAAGDVAAESTIERTRDPAHGHFASNLAMRLAKPARRSPRDLAAAIVEQIADTDELEKVEIAGPGFINFTLSPAAFHAEIRTILGSGEDYGRHAPKSSPRILLEFVSANPTGPLHVGHGRHASYGATVGNLLETVGYPVHREYYVNDAGRQMDILVVSVWLRWLEARGTAVPFPAAGYRGDYIRDIAAAIDTDGIDAVDAATVLEGVPADAPDGDKEAHIGALI